VTLNVAFADKLSNLSRKSARDHYNPYSYFDWPDALPEDQLWMPADLLSLCGMPFYDELTPRQLVALTKWESINFYSLIIHGIREVIDEVIARIHTPEFAHVSDYLHHLIGEENNHMWFFAKFCLDYGGKIYPDRTLRLEAALPVRVNHLLTFARIAIFEEIVDYYNVKIGQDHMLHPIIQSINTTHHRDESRHVAFGREFVRELYKAVADEHGSHGTELTEAHIRRYLSHCIDLFYSAPAYRDAGLADPFKLRNQVRKAPERAAFHRNMLARTVNFLVGEGILRDRENQ
jgi:hypothetical protein